MRAAVGLPLLAALTHAANVSTTLPKIDFRALGKTAILGDFAGIQVYDGGYAAALSRAQVSDDRSTLWSRSPGGDLLPLGSTDVGGQINALCQSGQSDGLLYVGGNFTRINDVSARNLALYNPKTQTFGAVGNGLDGPVLVLNCDDESNTLYIGGDFQGPPGNSNAFKGNVATWAYSGTELQPPSFGGLDGPVRAILPAGGSDSSRSIFFGGEFAISVGNSTANTQNSEPTIPSLGSSLSPISLNTSYVWAGADQASSDPYSALCPIGDGSTGSNWLAPDDTAAIFVVRTYEPLQARGVRIGNVFANGRGTTQFKLLTIPDSIVQPLQYYSNPSDPTSALATCQWECPLSTNSSIPYQDFLFPEGLNITGFQLDVDAWQGQGGGFHQVSLLSDGAFAFAVNALNGNSTTACDSGLAQSSPASASTTGDWQQVTVPSNVDGVDTQVLVATAPIGSTDSPSITFSPNIIAQGEYNVFLLTPGCESMDDCDSRTSVDVTTNPGPSQGQTVTFTVDQRTQSDASVSIYTGPLTSGATFSLKLSSTPVGSGSGGNYQLVAQKIQIVAQSTNGTALTSAKSGRALFEYIPEKSFGVFGDGQATVSSDLAATALTNASAFDELSLNFRNSTNSINAFVFARNAVFYGGAFAASGNVTTSNIGVYFGKNPMNLAVPAGGLNGQVTALLVVGDYLYAAGSFNSTSDGSVAGLAGFARWNIGSGRSNWEALAGPRPNFADAATGLVQGSVDGDDAVFVQGSLDSFAIFNTKSSSWDASQSNFIVGTTTTAVAANANDGSTFVAGTLSAALKFAASGSAVLQSNSSGLPSLVPFDLNISEGSTSGQRAGSRQNQPDKTRKANKKSSLTTLFSKTTAFLTSRQASAPVDSLPSAISLDGDAQVLAGTFYNNGSEQMVAIGGRFTSGDAQNIGTFDPSTKVISPLNDSNTLDGSVLALETLKDTLYIGGSFLSSAGTAFAVYDLSKDSWLIGPPALTGYAGENATVNVIAIPSGNVSEVVVAGNFETAGALTCNSICVWNTAATQWNSLGTGLRGVVGALDFAGARDFLDDLIEFDLNCKDSAQYIFAAGDFVVGSTQAYAARYDTSKSQWETLGSTLPGPATAIAADNYNEKNLFVAGVSTDNATPYLMRWNGSAWSDVNGGSLEEGSRVEQIAFLPLSSKHAGNDNIESDRMLLVNGALTLAGIGAISSVLFDGITFMPFLTTSTASGAAGVTAAFVYSAASFTLSRHNLSVGIVILISIAIALGVVFLFVLIGLLFALRHRDAQESKAQVYPVGVPYADDSEKTKQRPTSLLATLNAATARVASGQHETPERSRSPSPGFHSDEEGVGAAVGYPSGPTDYGDDADVVRTRYSFEAENQGEINVDSNEEIKVLDRGDGNWYYIERATGERGVVPASFLF